MVKNEISEFIAESIDQVKSGLPKDCTMMGNIDFDISLVTTKEKEGKIGIHVAGVGGSSRTQQVHRIRFSVIDKKSMKKNIEYAGDVIRELVSGLSKIEQQK
ncbi:unnamed protein product [marine sediment metagenome]|uniref:Uncharacterized protein n=1 Tax=marine sediment metagenome TaxID=412755 RepID=X0X8F0_9ZZZZ